MRNITRSLGLIIGAALLFSGCLPSEATEDTMKLWYDKPADKWMKSLPLGNGRHRSNGDMVAWKRKPSA